MTDKLTNYTSYYKTPDDSHNFKIKIRLKEEISDTDNEEEEKWHIKEFVWQEKHFNKDEREYYSNVKNCITEQDKKYHELIANGEGTEDAIFFTYINPDYSSSEYTNNLNDLEKLMNNLNTQENETIGEYDFEKSVLNSWRNQIIPSNIEKMSIGADLGEYIDDVWIQNENILCEIKYDNISKSISVFPDFTTTKPYTLKIQRQTLRYVHYFVEHSSTILAEVNYKENDVLRKISEKKISMTKTITDGDFFQPPKNKLFVYLFFDIISALGFEYDDLFVQYFIDLPEHWFCETADNLSGVTSICHSKGQKGIVHYGHNFDIVLEYDIQSLQDTRTPQSPCIYFQLTSKLSWERYRTEGITYQILPISRPGCYVYNLLCYRFDSEHYTGKLRRHFIGDAYNYKDIKWIGLPKDHTDSGTFNKFGINTVGTGEIKFRVNVLHQSQAFLKEFSEGDQQGKHIYEKLNSSSLIKSVNQVLVAFKKARRKMYEVKKQL